MVDAASVPGRVGYAVGTGRCGTHFLSRVLALEPAVAANHERNPMNEAFRRYCRWYDLPVDGEGFLSIKHSEIRADLERRAFSFEASAYLSLSVDELFERFGARFVLMIRRPDEVVNSFWSKGWYERSYVQGDPAAALGFQDLPDPHHNFARFAPAGADFPRWNALTRVGKIAWFWNALNVSVWRQFQQLPAAHWRVMKLEELSFDRYRELMDFFGVPATISEAQYRQIEASRPGRRERTLSLGEWSAQEIAEFEEQVRPGAQLFGYEHRHAHLPHARPAAVPARPAQRWLGPVLRRVRHLIAARSPGR